ncbi:hypothetical protein JHK86_055607 [Glycine max]|nr:hypothetical protein JHK86_055607 [Glycine max]
MAMNMKMSYRVMLVLFSLFMFVIPSKLIMRCDRGAPPETPISCIGRPGTRPPKTSASSFEVARPVPPSFNRPRNKGTPYVHYP